MIIFEEPKYLVIVGLILFALFFFCQRRGPGNPARVLDLLENYVILRLPGMTQTPCARSGQGYPAWG